MSWVMRSPSCSHAFRSCASVGALGVVGEQVAQQQRGSAARCARPPRRAPSGVASTGAVQRSSSGENMLALVRPRRRRFHDFFTTRSRALQLHAMRAHARRCASVAAARCAEHALRTRCTRASWRSGSARASCWPRPRADAVGARVRAARRDGPARRRDRHARGAVQHASGAASCAPATARWTST